MKKGYSTIGIIIASMIVMVVGFSFTAKDKLDIKTIEGDINELGDVSLVYTPAIKDLKKEEIVINKDGVKSILKSDNTIGRDFVKSSSEHNDIIKNQFVERIYENEEYIGVFSFTNSYITPDNNNMEVIIKEKNKTTNEIKEYQIPVSLKNNENELSITEYYATKYKDSVYSISFDYSDGPMAICIFKTDIKNQTSEIIARKEINENIQYGWYKFTVGNKIYIQLDEYSDYTKSYFLVFDMDKNTFSESNEFMNSKYEDGQLLNKSVLDYNVTGNKLNILIKDNVMYKRNTSNVTKLVYNIDNDKVTLEDTVDYDLNIAYDYYISQAGADYDDSGVVGIKKVKMVDDKIYSIYQKTTTLSRKTDSGQRVIVKGNKPVEILVFDTTKNKTVYKGEITTGDVEIGRKLFLVKNY